MHSLLPDTSKILYIHGLELYLNSKNVGFIKLIYNLTNIFPQSTGRVI